MSAPSSAFGHPQFRMLIVVATISYIGTFVQEIGERWLILELTQSPLPSALLATLFVVAALVAMLPSGILADRYDRRRILAISQGGAACTAGVMAFLAATGHVTPTMLMVGVVFLGLAMALAAPSWNAFFGELLPRDKIAEGVAANAVAFNVARAVGPAVGGVVLDTFGAPVSFALNAASFAVVTGFFVTMRGVPYPRRPAGAQVPVRRQFAEPLAIFRHDAGVRSVLIAMLLVSVGASMMYALAPAYGKTTLGATPRQYGIMVGAMGLGAVLASTGLRALRARFLPRQVVGGAVLLYAVTTFGLARASSIPLAVALFLPIGMAWIATFSSMTALVQVWTRDAVRGRVLALYMIVHLGSWAFGSTLGGLIASHWSVRTALGVGAALCFGFGLLIRRLPMPTSFVGLPNSIPPPVLVEDGPHSVR